eukprot:g17017.t1
MSIGSDLNVVPVEHLSVWLSSHVVGHAGTLGSAFAHAVQGIQSFQGFYSGHFISVAVNLALLIGGTWVYTGLDNVHALNAAGKLAHHVVVEEVGGLFGDSFQRGHLPALVAYVAVAALLHGPFAWGAFMAVCVALPVLLWLRDDLVVRVNVAPPGHLLTGQWAMKRKMRADTYMTAALNVARPRQEAWFTELRQLGRDGRPVHGPLSTLAMKKEVDRTSLGDRWQIGQLISNSSDKEAAAWMIDGSSQRTLDPIEDGVLVITRCLHFDCKNKNEGTLLPEKQPESLATGSKFQTWSVFVVEMMPEQSQLWPQLTRFPNFYLENPNRPADAGSAGRDHYGPLTNIFVDGAHDTMATFTSAFWRGNGRVSYSIGGDQDSQLYEALAAFPEEIQLKHLPSKMRTEAIDENILSDSELKNVVSLGTGHMVQTGSLAAWRKMHNTARGFDVFAEDTAGAECFADTHGLSASPSSSAPTELRTHSTVWYPVKLQHSYSSKVGAAQLFKTSNQCVPYEWEKADYHGSATYGQLAFRGPWQSHLVESVRAANIGPESPGDTRFTFTVAVRLQEAQRSAREPQQEAATLSPHEVSCKQLFELRDTMKKVLEEKFLANQAAGWTGRRYVPPPMCACQAEAS